jgi:glycosyltransferase involved in cell wall biosynthesis
MGQKKQKQKRKLEQQMETNKPKLPKMCLCMIVKNEAHVIKETLNNMLKYIDYWVISDTGSTDGTQEIIKDFFKQKKIPGELVENEWKNFGHNRTLAFEAAYKKSEYVWVIDADDLIVGNLILPKLNKDMYLLNYGNKDFSYARTQIFNNQLKWCYRGVLHEFSKCLDKEKPTSFKIEGDYFVDSRRLGDRNKDTQKYLKDGNLLIEAIENNIDPDLHGRYYFYAAQSFRDYKDLEKAIKYYKIRTEKDGWHEELYVSYMELGLAMIEKKYKIEEIKEAFMNGFKVLPRRAECLYFLAKYYFENKKIEDAYKTCKIASKIIYPIDLVLFIKKDIHDYKTKELLLLILIYAKKTKVEIKNLTDENLDKEIDLLFEFMTKNKLVPYEEKQKFKNLKEFLNKVLIEPPMLDDYVFIDNTDSFGDDIGYFHDKSIEDLEEISSICDNCIAFNTYGYLKHSINLPMIILPNKNYFNDGIYVKKEIAYKLVNKFGTDLINLKENKKFDLNNLSELD